MADQQGNHRSISCPTTYWRIDFKRPISQLIILALVPNPILRGVSLLKAIRDGTTLLVDRCTLDRTELVR